MTDSKIIKKINDKVVDYLASVKEEEKNQMEVLINIKEELFKESEDYETINKQISLLQEILALGVEAAGEDKYKYANDKLSDYLKKLAVARKDFVDTKYQEIGMYFNKIAYRNANYIKINRELAKINAVRTVYNEQVINDSLATIGDCYGISDSDLAIILKFMSQVRLRTKMLYDNGKCDIRNYHQPNDFGIMPAFYGEQGCGKSAFASILGDIISNGKCSIHGPDEIMGSFGTLDVFSKPVILLNEYGKQNKDGTDELKKYINGEVVTVNQKYKDPVTENCFASFILTSNFDPTQLNGQETGSRRICVVNFTHYPTKSLEEIEKAVKNLWSCVDESTFEKFWGKNAEWLAKNNLKKQQNETVSEWLSGLCIDTLEWLKDKCHTVSKIQNYLNNAEHSMISKNRLKCILSNTDFFTESVYGRNKYYALKPNAYECPID